MIAQNCCSFVAMGDFYLLSLHTARSRYVSIKFLEV